MLPLGVFLLAVAGVVSRGGVVAAGVVFFFGAAGFAATGLASGFEPQPAGRVRTTASAMSNTQRIMTFVPRKRETYFFSFGIAAWILASPSGVS